MNIFRYFAQGHLTLAVMTEKGDMFKLEEKDFLTLVKNAKSNGLNPAPYIHSLIPQLTRVEQAFTELQLATPIDAPEVWAAGVTYKKSMEARNYEATDGKLDTTTFYDKVYAADRPELFIKSTVHRTVGPNDFVYLRSDSNWQVPEAELGLVLDDTGTIIGFIIGNDMSCRDIEGENPLYLPQAKIWRNSCSIGPFIRLAETVDNPYELNIGCKIYRDKKLVVAEQANTRQLNRTFEELVQYLRRDNELFAGTVLLTGTCLVPPNQFTLQDGDRIEIDIDGLGTLVNIARDIQVTY